MLKHRRKNRERGQTGVSEKRQWSTGRARNVVLKKQSKAKVQEVSLRRTLNINYIALINQLTGFYSHVTIQTVKKSTSYGRSGITEKSQLTMGTTGPDDMYFIRPGKNFFSFSSS